MLTNSRLFGRPLVVPREHVGSRELTAAVQRPMMREKKTKKEKKKNLWLFFALFDLYFCHNNPKKDRVRLFFAFKYIPAANQFQLQTYTTSCNVVNKGMKPTKNKFCGNKS